MKRKVHIRPPGTATSTEGKAVAEQELGDGGDNGSLIFDHGGRSFDRDGDGVLWQELRRKNGERKLEEQERKKLEHSEQSPHA
ncbi:hypothetical protein PIB30_075307 [Stylosanthes scabra]|uniref:Uncharacterized protein n=1 Tax=Stylosanthes scabra TaxID=79078 RepID=A0ABU6VPM8_9FABA|nr:hypothetical protein [Stylosanthes scabra]